MASRRLWQRLFGGLFSRGVGKNESPSPPSAPQQPPKAAQGGVSRKAPTQRPPSPAVAPRQAPSDQGTGKRPAELSNLQTPTKTPQNQPRPADQVEPRALSELQSPVQRLPGQGPPVGGTMVMSTVPAMPTIAAKLVVRSGGEQGKSFELKEGRVIMGRSPDGDIQLDHPSISLTHALIRVTMILS